LTTPKEERVLKKKDPLEEEKNGGREEQELSWLDDVHAGHQSTSER
jgi:hypothetical protein